jgi:hypothetical protein
MNFSSGPSAMVDCCAWAERSLGELGEDANVSPGAINLPAIDRRAAPSHLARLSQKERDAIAIGQRFGDKTTVLGALMLMLIGGLVMAFSDSWTGQFAGRLVAGAGGVLINVQMTKMVTDWFAGREIAMPRSWPARSCFGRSIAFPQRCSGQRNHDLVQPALTSC